MTTDDWMTAATGTIPTAALPPEAQVSDLLRSLAILVSVAAGQPQWHAGVLRILRLGSPHGELSGLALTAPSQQLAWPCQIAAAFMKCFGVLADCAEAVSASLQDGAVLAAYPELLVRPRANSNLLFDLHTGLAEAPAYRSLVTDLQMGLITALDRTGWQRTRAAAHSLDALATAGLRVIPQVDAASLDQALQAGDPQQIAGVFHRAADQLCYVKRPAVRLPEATRRGYLRDCCYVLGHPEWVSAPEANRPLGQGLHSRSAWLESDDDPPEVGDAPDRWREKHVRRVEVQVRRELMPGAGIQNAIASVARAGGLHNYAEELAVLREFEHSLSWHCAHPNDVAGLIKLICRDRGVGKAFRLEDLDDMRLGLRTAMLSLPLTGRSLEWLVQVRKGQWPEPGAMTPQSAPVYVVEADAIVYWPEEFPDLPTRPQCAADLYEAVNEIWVLPLSEIAAPWWRELARRRRDGELMLGVTPEQVKRALQDATRSLRRDLPHRPALTVGRLRAAFWVLMIRIAQMHPLLAAYISGQRRPSIRVPSFYATVTLDSLARKYRAAADEVWSHLLQFNPGLPARPAAELGALPEWRMGSPYCPRLDVLTNCIAALHVAVANAPDEEARHNTQTLLALYGLAIIVGNRMSESSTCTTDDFDLDAIWNGDPAPYMMVPEAKGNRWTTAARFIPLPQFLADLIRSVMAEERGDGAFFFLDRGRRVRADEDEIRKRLKAVGVPFPRWHAGRHWVETTALDDDDMAFDDLNAILGHQSAGRECFNPYVPNEVGVLWAAFRRFCVRLARRLSWPGV